MKKLLILLFLTLSQIIQAQNGKNVSVFHRLLIYNTDNEIMLVRFKDSNIWVTPGFYQDNKQYIQKGLHDIATTYGITVSNPELKGVFSMKSENGEHIEMRIRNIYRCNYLHGKIKVPKNLGEVKWLPIKEALKTITYKSINLFLKQTHNYPNVVWGGSIIALKKEIGWKYEIVEEFYPLFYPKNETNTKNK